MRFLRKTSPTGLLSSQLYDNETFYRAFERDLAFCKREVIIESPFITTRRLKLLLPALIKLRSRGVRVIINTREPEEHEGHLYSEAQRGLILLNEIGVEIFYTCGHHRKLAIFDRHILWEGSLNILSHNESCEIMRRVESCELATQMVRFIKLHKHLGA